MSILGEIQKFNGEALIELYELDTSYQGGTKYYFHAGTNEIGTNIIWQGQEYTKLPLEVTGYEVSSDGYARPKIQMANISGVFSAMAIQMNDLVGCKLTRKRTLGMYLDAANFSDGNPTANPDEHFVDDIFYIVQKTQENKVLVEFELGSSLDLQGVMLPKRQVIAGTCCWRYRSEECGYTGGPCATNKDVATVISSQDQCSKTITGCKFRFGQNGILRFGGFPGSALVDLT